MKLLIATGFTALIVTIVACTYVLNGTIKRYSFDSREIVNAISDDGQLTRDVLAGRSRPSTPEPLLLPWRSK